MKGTLRLALLSTIACPAGVWAQTEPVEQSAAAAETGDVAPAGSEDEIIVTARRRAENLQDVPISVTAFSGEALAERNVDSIDQIARFTPNIRFDTAAQLSGASFNPTVFIRGVGSNDFAIFTDPGVGFYIDGVYYARSIGAVTDAVDLESVQVLRGPQGTLFGRNTIGGAVIIETAKPQLDQVSGKVEAITGSYDRIDLRGAVNLPLVQDRLALRLSAATLNRDGYVKRLSDGEDMGNRNTDMVRAQLRWQPDPRLTIDLAGDYTRSREHSAPNDIVAIGLQPNLPARYNLSGAPWLARYNQLVAPTLGIVNPADRKALDGSWITADPYETWAGGPNVNDLDLWGLQGTIAFDVSKSLQLKSITAYRDMHATFARDGDNTPYTFRETFNDDKVWQFSQELQANGSLGDGLRFVTGLYYLKEKGRDFGRADLAVGIWPPLVTTPPLAPAVFLYNWIDNESYAAYGEIDIDLARRLTLTLGGRYNHDSKKIRIVNVRQRDATSLVGGDLLTPLETPGLVRFIDSDAQNIPDSESWSSFTPRVILKADVTDDVNLYASFSRGFKSGGFNLRPLTGPEEVTAYDPETLTTWELGAKTRWLDRRLTLNAAVWKSRYKDIQLSVNQTPLNFVANATGKLWGFEVEAVARPATWLDLNASIGHVDSHYTEISNPRAPNQALPLTLDDRFVKAPRWTLAAGAQISIPLGRSGNLRLRGDVTDYSRIYNDLSNHPYLTENGYTLVNLRLTWTDVEDRYSVALFGTNITDALFIQSGNFSNGFGLAEVSYGRPREWGVSASLRF
ncbi:TonB-dependent receptor [Sphingosinicella sp. BN140058]|uniref:TonB-dependent receptor n=1 Tax=Sphingosinicella sp. BN140058 TaxID=1892855 RepID=UPI001011CABF|nr:TonB-dependent receptor [Sphingosinicella sp. BN140058]QAY79414.1 TonB-dependent receptor [Sphingosinicella sp. BN140058]